MGNCIKDRLPTESLDFEPTLKHQPTRETQSEYPQHKQQDKGDVGKKVSSAPPAEDGRKGSLIWGEVPEKVAVLDDRDSLDHLRAYKHIHVVRQPSFTENSAQIAMLEQDSGEIWKLINP
jgi:hypothetical protein